MHVVENDCGMDIGVVAIKPGGVGASGGNGEGFPEGKCGGRLATTSFSVENKDERLVSTGLMDELSPN